MSAGDRRSVGPVRPHHWTVQESRANDAYASIDGVLLRTGAQARHAVNVAAAIRARLDLFSPLLRAPDGLSQEPIER